VLVTNEGPPPAALSDLKSLGESGIKPWLGGTLSLQKVGQLGNVRRNAPRLVHREHFRRVGLRLRLAGIDIGERLPGRVLHDIAARDLFRVPGRGEAGRHRTPVSEVIR
jgi:hypothetical protein